MRDFLLLKGALERIVSDMGFDWPAKAVIEAPRDPAHGDLATNLALVLNKEAGMPPRELAGAVAAKLAQLHPGLESSIAGPGFLNIRFAPDFWLETVTHIDRQGDDYGRVETGDNRKVMVEYVSANPTGPLHIGHGRGAAVGDSLARLLRFAGYDVTTEYYINDAGRQMRLLGLSVYLRLREEVGLSVEWPEDYYKGEYIKDIAVELLNKRPELTTLPPDQAEDICYDYGMNSILEGIKADLRHFRVEHQVWFSEKSLVESGRVEKTLDWLKKEGLAYEKDNALWFNSERFGDDKERVLRKSDGTLTYFASDIAYHDDKFKRGFKYLIDVWGADHHGYVPRMKNAISALGEDADNAFHVVLIQLVNLLRGGEQVAMSTRSGEFVTLEEVVREVGVDAARFMFLSRKSDSPLDFDLELVKQRNLDNPVYYVQYAHARVAALLRRAAEDGITLPDVAETSMLGPLALAEELTLLKELERFQDTVRDAALARSVHSVSHYLMELAGLLHSYYANHPILNEESRKDEGLVIARLCMMRAVGRVLANGLNLLGVDAPGSM